MKFIICTIAMAASLCNMATAFPREMHDARSMSLLEVRGPNIDSVSCDPIHDKDAAFSGPIKKGIEYLREGDKKCDRDADGKKQRVSCSWNSAIYVINNTKHKILIDCDDVADHAQAIWDKCGHHSPNGADEFINGYSHDERGYSVHVYHTGGEDGGC
ncbi:hypothetical protein MKZ38_009610 [Zalerion maritima]|uniref:Uncharacterized protein n=1 Tax=Zalerion maritima TaxID=339359 RepID=A0AAD5WNH9_9PEZI|nr:hypothetical protein MKZ38_009610 [Zalerion maritima]